MRGRPVVLVIMLLATLVVVACSEPEDTDFKVIITMSDSSGRERTAEIYLVDGKAVEVDSGRLESVLDLGGATLTDVDSGRTVTLVECIAWMDEITETNTVRLSQAADSHNKWYRQRMLDPQFEVEEVGGLLVLRNEYFLYRISAAPDISPEKAAIYYDFDRLNSHCGPMARSELPQNISLAILDELESRGMLPATMFFERDFANEIFSATVSYEYRALTPEERTRVAEWFTKY